MLDERSKELRRLMIRMIAADRRGHLASAASLVELLRVIYDSWLVHKPDLPTWEQRDRLILSKGHGCLALYALLADKGYISHDDLDQFCKPNAKLGGHPEIKIPGIEASTGSLGHGLPIAVGMALAAKIKHQSHRVIVIVGDGELNEGSTWEAALSAAKHRLSNLVLCIDRNNFQSYGLTREVLSLEPLATKLRAFGFQVREVDGHDVDKLTELFSAVPFGGGAPSAIVARSIKGKGFSFAENCPDWHHKSRMTDSDIAALYECVR